MPSIVLRWLDRYSEPSVEGVMTVFSKQLHNQGLLLLLLTTVIWGTSFPLLKQALGSLPPAVILSARFTIAAAAFVPWLRHCDRRLIRDGMVLGSVYFTECVTALMGLETISANRSAFLVSLNVLLVPLLSTVLGRPLPQRALLLAAAAIGGIGLMSWEGGGLAIGDWLTFACAVGVAIYILLLERIATSRATLPLVAVQLFTMAVLASVWAAPDLIEHLALINQHSNVLLYLGLIVTATPIWTQAIAQRWIPAYEAALIYTLEPVLAAVFSFWLLDEQLGLRGFLGAALILVATIMSNVSRRSHEHDCAL
jgi:drug/metabolite transporter (DMT)-like permease